MSISSTASTPLWSNPCWVDVAYLREAFAAIDLAYGSFETYAAAALGIDPERRRRLMQLLTEPDGG